MAILAPPQVYALSRQHGFSPADSLAIVGIAATESGGNTASVQGGGKGRGLIQIDLGQHPDVTEAQALDPNWSLDWLKRQGGPSKVTFYGPRDNAALAQRARVEALKANPEQNGPSLLAHLFNPVQGLDDIGHGAAAGAAAVVPGVASIADFLATVGKLTLWLANPRNWLRVVEVIMGAALVVFGLYRMSPTASTAVHKTAKTAVAALAVA